MDPVRLRQSLSSSPEFRRKPLLIAVPAVASVPAAELHIIYIYQEERMLCVCVGRGVSAQGVSTQGAVYPSMH